MPFLRQISHGLSRWIDCVAGWIVAAYAKVVAAPAVQLTEEADGVFAVRAPKQKSAERIRIVDGKVIAAGNAAALLKSSRAELVLRSDSFLFRPLELPRRATEFLDGIVRAQIDRLTPWKAEDAAFGWSAPADIANDRILVTVAATARTLVMPLVGAIAGLGADSIVVSTLAPGAPNGPAAIKVFDQRVRGALEFHRVRRAIAAVLLAAGLLAGAAIAADVIVGSELDARQADLSRRIAAQRAKLRAGHDAVRDSALAALERHRHETPSSVIVLEVLSQILPDHTYVTELRIQGDKMQVVGVTRDAPSLIRLIEQSTHFTRATFFAPTTRSPSEAGEHFHIEARIEPVFTPRS
ncbi:MAG TPA: PilN domain-containing protein [Xanthobacteraceae bacterium]|jgi:general secretion pathway protein L|nr:PilN domain-containing protein [Xanthobacteraceae bacterium]